MESESILIFTYLRCQLKPEKIRSPGEFQIGPVPACRSNASISAFAKWIIQGARLSDEINETFGTAISRSSSARKELRYLRALFNFGMHPTRNWIRNNPTRGIQFFPVEKRIKYVPPKEDVLRVILAADHDTQDYLWTIAMTMGRMSEVNRLTWVDVDFEERSITLYTRKKRGGHLTPRKIPMTDKLHGILLKRYNERDKHKQWVFWHRFWDRAKGQHVEGQYLDRKRIMTSLCRKAGVRYFRFHALRHFGASLLDASNVPIGSIQRILGHENRSTTEIYLHSIGEGERGAMRVFEDRFCEKSHTESHTEQKGVTADVL